MNCSARPAPRSVVVRAILLGLFAAPGLAGCDSTGPGVASVSVTAAGDRVEVGKTLQLTASARKAGGTELTGRRFTWTSDNEAVATVSPEGLVTGKAVGAANITAATGGKSGSLLVSVIPVAVASVSVSPDTATLPVGSTRSLSATLKDASGAALTGRAVSWSSDNETVATVSPQGVVTARGVGSATITAAVEGKKGTARITGVLPQGVRVAVSPAFATVDVGGSVTLQAVVLDPSGNAIPGAAVSWSSTASGVAAAQGGTVTGAAAGRAGIVARVDGAADTAAVAVLGPKSLLSTAFAGGSARADVRPGQTVMVPITLDLSKVSANGDLGAAQFELAFDTTVLRYVSASPGVSTGSTDSNLASPGLLRFVLASTAPQGSARITLVTFTFQVQPGAPAGRVAELAPVFPASAPPTSTGFQAYEVPITVGGRIRVVSP